VGCPQGVTLFVAMLGRVLPTQLTGDNPVSVQRIERVVIEPVEHKPAYPVLTLDGQPSRLGLR
jgi:hypothetical protein